MGPLENSLCVTEEGVVHIAMTSSGNSQLIYFTYKDGSWSHEEFPGLIRDPSNLELLIDLEGRAHISFYENVNHVPLKHRLIYYSNSSGNWQKEEIAEGKYFYAKKMKRINGKIIQAFIEEKTVCVAERTLNGWKKKQLPRIDSFYKSAIHPV